MFHKTDAACVVSLGNLESAYQLVELFSQPGEFGGAVTALVDLFVRRADFTDVSGDVADGH